MIDKSIAVVRHVTRDHVTIAPRDGYSVVTFNIRAGTAIEAIVTADDGSETVRLLVAGPTPDQTVSIERAKTAPNITNIYYRGKSNG